MTSARARTALPFICASLLTAALVGCGGGGSSDDPVALCKQSCDKVFSLCFADAGSLGTSAKSTCDSNCSNSSTSQTTKTCSNSSAMISAFKGCLNKSTCNDLMTCEGSIPACQGSSTGGGTAGSTSGGTAGGTSGGKAGSTGGGSGGTCADLLACCNKTSANLKSPCMMAYTMIMSSGDMGCGLVLSGIKASYCP